MLNDTSRWSHTPVNRVVPYRWQATRMHPASHAALLPLMRLWRLTVCYSWNNGPHPVDTPHAHVTGPGPDRVLLLGGPLVTGYGVLTHQLGLVGHIARQHHRPRRRTGSPRRRRNDDTQAGPAHPQPATLPTGRRGLLRVSVTP